MLPREEQMLKLLTAMHEEDRQSLVAFAEFLISRRSIPEPLPQEPELRERPANETVVSAIKRLSASYTMLDKGILLNQTSALMSQHIMEGRDAAEVIDDLEELFAKQYAALTKQLEKS